MTIKSSNNVNLNSLKEILKTLIEESTAHGIPRLIRSRKTLMKIIWLVFTIVSFLMCIINTLSAVFNFLD